MKNDSSIENLSVQERQSLADQIKAREIVRTVLDYGVSQRQIVYIVKMLSLELEDVQVMQKINELLSESPLLSVPEIVDDSSSKRPQTKIYT